MSAETLIPNSNPAIARLKVCVCAADEYSPESVEIEEVPVIAWRVSREEVEPVCADLSPFNCEHEDHTDYDYARYTVLIDRTTGACWDGESHWNTRAECIEALLFLARRGIAHHRAQASKEPQP